MANRFILNETSYFGAGSREVLAGEIARRGFKKAFIVADKDLIKFGTVKMVTDVLADFPYVIFSDFKANPTVTNVKNGVEAYKKNMFALLEKPGYEADSKAIKERLAQEQ